MDDKKMWRPEFFEGWADSLNRTANQIPDTQSAMEGAAGQLRTAAAQMREFETEIKRLRKTLDAAEKVVEAARVYTSDFECDFFAEYDKLKEEK